jgi:hypothetical protein
MMKEKTSIPKIIALCALTTLCLCAKGQAVYMTNIYRTNGYPVTLWETNKIWFTNEQEIEDGAEPPYRVHDPAPHWLTNTGADTLFTNMPPGDPLAERLAKAAIERADEARQLARQALWSARASLAILLSTFLSMIFLYWKSGRETK